MGRTNTSGVFVNMDMTTGTYSMNDAPTITDIHGIRQWRLNGRWHRLDGPAYVNTVIGLQQWYVDGLRHRYDGPAVIWSDGAQRWYVNGQLHRIDGPAAIDADGHEEWWVNDQQLDREKIEQWMELKEITWPWDELTQAEFLLTWT